MIYLKMCMANRLADARLTNNYGFFSSHPVQKAYCMTWFDLTLIISFFPDRKEVPADQRLHIRLVGGWKNPKEIMADLDRHCIIKLVNMFGVLLFHCYMGSDQLAEIIQCQPGPDLLDDKIRFPAVKSRQTDGIFEFAERCFHTPAPVVKLLQGIRRELVRREVCHQVFISPSRQADADNAK